MGALEATMMGEICRSSRYDHDQKGAVEFLCRWVGERTLGLTMTTTGEAEAEAEAAGEAAAGEDEGEADAEAGEVEGETD